MTLWLNTYRDVIPMLSLMVVVAARTNSTQSRIQVTSPRQPHAECLGRNPTYVLIAILVCLLLLIKNTI